MGGLCALFLVAEAEAKSELRKILPGGFVFPAFSDAISVNPSYLLHEKRRNLSLFYEPPDSDSAPNQHDASLAFASSNGRFGYGVKYESVLNDSTNQFDHNEALGFGMGTKEFALAVAVKLLTEDSALSHYVNLAFRYGKGGMYYQLVMHEVNADTLLKVGSVIRKGWRASKRAFFRPTLAASVWTRTGECCGRAGWGTFWCRGPSQCNRAQSGCRLSVQRLFPTQRILLPHPEVRRSSPNRFWSHTFFLTSSRLPSKFTLVADCARCGIPAETLQIRACRLL
ncbi:MAG: hypothetical protein R3B54_15070 [Bdellovibrionota bacterium]